MKLRATILVLAGTLISTGCTDSHTGDEDAAIVFDADFPDAGPDSGPPSSTVGAACGSDTDCTPTAPTCFDMAGFFPLPDGYCSTDCVADTDCPDGSACVQLGRGAAICMATCVPGSTEDQCRMGLGCSRGGRIPPVCLPGCEDDSDCTEGLACEADAGFLGEGACVDPTAALGGACTSDSDCPPSAQCLTEADSDYPGGTCVLIGCDPMTNVGCTTDSQCLPTGFGGICWDGCSSDGDCRPEYLCAAPDGFADRSICQPRFVPANLGQVCSAGRGSCAGGYCLSETQTGFPDSYCVALDCDPAASTPTCPGDGVCVETTDGGGLCLDGCTTGTDCRTAYECRPSDSEDPTSPLACLPACTMDGQCSGGGGGGTPMYVCNPGTGYCDQPFVLTRLGEPCVDGSDCPGGRCLGEDTAGWPAGTCTYPGCRLSGTGREAMCPTGGTCVDDGTGDPELGVCVDACATSASGECRPGYACVELSTGSAEGACRPACTDGDCGAGRTCSATTGLCE